MGPPPIHRVGQPVTMGECEARGGGCGVVEGRHEGWRAEGRKGREVLGGDKLGEGYYERDKRRSGREGLWHMLLSRVYDMKWGKPTMMTLAIWYTYEKNDVVQRQTALVSCDAKGRRLWETGKLLGGKKTVQKIMYTSVERQARVMYLPKTRNGGVNKFRLSYDNVPLQGTGH